MGESVESLPPVSTKSKHAQVSQRYEWPGKVGELQLLLICGRTAQKHGSFGFAFRPRRKSMDTAPREAVKWRLVWRSGLKKRGARWCHCQASRDSQGKWSGHCIGCQARQRRRGRTDRDPREPDWLHSNILLWMDEIRSHHLRSHGKPLFAGIYKGIILSGLLGGAGFRCIHISVAPLASYPVILLPMISLGH